MKKQIIAALALCVFACSCSNETVTAPEGGKAPLPPYAMYNEGLIEQITPQGWIAEILKRQNEGLTGHPEAMDYPFDSCLWAGELERDASNRGADWWRFEQTAYYLDGLIRLGYLIDDEALKSTGYENIKYVMEHPLPAKKGIPYDEKQLNNMTFGRQWGQRPQGQRPQGQRQQGQRPQGQQGQRPQNFQRPPMDFNAQMSADPAIRQRLEAMRERRARQMRIAALDRPEGRLGQEVSSQAWPFSLFFRVMQAYYYATGDMSIPAALEKNYLTYNFEEIGVDRAIVNVEGILWTYSLTGNPALLQLAKDAWATGAFDLNATNCLDDSELHMHGVTYNEIAKIPMILYSYTGEEQYLKQAIHANEKMEAANMLADGINSSTEALNGNDPLAGHETCDISDYTWTIGYYLMTTGDAKWADRIEKAIFNAGFGAVTKDFKTLQYFSGPNQVIATGNSNHNGFKYGLTWMEYRTAHETECCAGNLHRYMPNYAARMWMNGANEKDIISALYGPSTFTQNIGDGITVQIEEKTAYPFDEKIEYVFNFYKDGKKIKEPQALDFSFRIPGWCEGASAKLNGKAADVTTGKTGFVKVSREWKSGDRYTVTLPMHIEVLDNPVQGKYVERGPILYTFAVPANVEEDTKVYDNLAGKKSGNPDFKQWSMTPAGKWNYAIAADKLSDIKLKKTGAKGFPFDLDKVPFKISVPVVGVKDWDLKENRFTPALPETVIPESEEVSYIELVPYGSTTLRLTTFPVYQK